MIRLWCFRLEWHFRGCVGMLTTRRSTHPACTSAAQSVSAIIDPFSFFNFSAHPDHSNERRLLHPGADTKVILTQYVSLIRCLRIIDPPGVLLFKVADPIRRYLR
jgi:hypothetical protein